VKNGRGNGSIEVTPATPAKAVMKE